MKVSTIHLLVFLCALATFCFALPVDIQGVPETNIPHLEPAVYPRVVQAVVGAIVRIGQAIGKLVSRIKDGIKKDKENRGKFAVQMVGSMYAKDPSLNYICCHTKHHTTFGNSWGHKHVEFDVQIGGTIGFECYYGKAGVFTITGDAGFLNVAYQGTYTRNKNHKVITFTAH